MAFGDAFREMESECYNEGISCFEHEGEFIGVDGDCDVRTELVTAPEIDNVLTTQRARTLVAPDLGAESRVKIPLSPGWGHLSSIFGPDFIQVVVDAARDNGIENPTLIGLNYVGKGTRDGEFRNAASAIRDADYDKDAGNQLEMLHQEGIVEPGDIMVPIGHSLGAFEVDSQIRHHHGRAMDSTITDAAYLMPGVRMSGAYFDSQLVFLRAVLSQILPGVQRMGDLQQGDVPFVDDLPLKLGSLVRFALRKYSGMGHGYEGMSLNSAHYDSIMMHGEEFSSYENWARTGGDSAMRFVQTFLNFRDGFQDVFERGGAASGTKLHIFRGEHDKLLPAETMNRFANCTRRNGHDVNGPVAGEDFGHMVSYKMTPPQKAQLSDFMDQVFAHVAEVLAAQG